MKSRSLVFVGLLAASSLASAQLTGFAAGVQMAQGCFGYCGQQTPPWQQPPLPPIVFQPLIGQDQPPGSAPVLQPIPTQSSVQSLLIQHMIQSGAPLWQIQYVIQHRVGR